MAWAPPALLRLSADIYSDKNAYHHTSTFKKVPKPSRRDMYGITLLLLLYCMMLSALLLFLPAIISLYSSGPEIDLVFSSSVVVQGLSGLNEHS